MVLIICSGKISLTRRSKLHEYADLMCKGTGQVVTGNVFLYFEIKKILLFNIFVHLSLVLIILCAFLKGNGNEADFLGFLQKLGPHRSLTLPFEPFRFWLRIRGDIRNRKTTPRLT
jgi:hypothetical protein